MTIELDAICRNSFDAFAQRVFKVVEPGTKYEWNWHMGCIAEFLEAVDRGEMQRLVINMPPRTLKSYLVAEAFPAWILGRRPYEKFIVGGYGSGLAKQRAQRCRAIMRDPLYQQMFPDTLISPHQDEKHHYHTTMHGQYYATGISGSVTGVGANYVILDDPLKPDEAPSDTIRNNTNENIRNTFFSRFNDPRTGKFIMVMQRVHEDDPTGNLARDHGYTVLKLPAEAHTSVHIKLDHPLKGQLNWKMDEGELLFPPRLTKAFLEEKRADLNEYNYAGQYLQSPVPLGGGEFRSEWIQYYPAGSIKPATMNIVILVDPSGGEELNKRRKKRSDWTAMMVVGLAPDNNYYLLDIVRDRLNPTDRIDTLFMLHRKWNELSGKPPKVGYEKYGMMTDTHYIKEKQKQDSYRFPIVELGGQMMKEERIRRLIPDLQIGRWCFPENIMYTDSEGRLFDLVSELVNSEMPTFPRARFDDMLDALSRVMEPDLNLVFPRPKTGLGQNMVARAEVPREESWLSY